MINNERIDQRNIFGEEMAGIEQVDMEKMMMRYGEEEAARLMEEIIKNNKNTKTIGGITSRSGKEKIAGR